MKSFKPSLLVAARLFRGRAYNALADLLEAGAETGVVMNLEDVKAAYYVDIDIKQLPVLFETRDGQGHLTTLTYQSKTDNTVVQMGIDWATTWLAHSDTEIPTGFRGNWPPQAGKEGIKSLDAPQEWPDHIEVLKRMLTLASTKGKTWRVVSTDPWMHTD